MTPAPRPSRDSATTAYDPAYAAERAERFAQDAREDYDRAVAAAKGSGDRDAWAAAALYARRLVDRERVLRDRRDHVTSLLAAREYVVSDLRPADGAAVALLLASLTGHPGPAVDRVLYGLHVDAEGCIGVTPRAVDLGGSLPGDPAGTYYVVRRTR